MSTASTGRTHGCTDQACDVKILLANSEPSTHGTKRTSNDVQLTSAFGGKADMGRTARDVCFSNRPFWVKRFQTIHHCCVEVARGLVLLFGIGTKALPSWDSRTRRNNLLVGLAVGLTVGPSRHANSPHPSSREGRHSTTRWSSMFSC